MKWLIFEKYLPVVLCYILSGITIPAEATCSENETGYSVSAVSDTIVVHDTIYMEKKQPQALTRYEKKEARFRLAWSRLIPRHFIVQYAGNIGLCSAGAGWTYGKKRKWGTDILFGFIPRFDSGSARITMTLKENFIPWNIALNHRKTILLNPLSCGLFLNTVFGEDFWAREPSRYPDSYYGFSTKIRGSIYLGQQLTVQVPSKKRIHFKSISFYYELSSCDIYMASAFTNRYLRPRDYLSLGFGVRLNVFD